MVTANNLHKFFGEFHAVRGLSLEIPPGTVVALLGPNGAGKSTTVRMLTAMIKPTRGDATIGGYNVVTQPQHVRTRVGLLTEYPGLYERMNALDYLLFFARLQGLAPAAAAARAETLLRRFDLWDAHKRWVGTYSKGMKQKVALIRSMLHDPQVLFLDEPTTAMDPQSAQVVREAIMELRDSQRVIVVCTHELHEAEMMADHIAVMRRGQIVARGTVAQLTREMLGAPTWEIETARPLDGAIAQLRQLVEVDRVGSTCLRYQTSDARHLNPVLIDRLQDAGVGVVSIKELPRSLQTVYLRLVGAPETTPFGGETVGTGMAQGV